MYWMTNPEHGVMPVYSLGEVEQAKVHGWELLNEGDSPKRAVLGSFAPAAGLGKRVDEVQFYEAPIATKRKPGRPPKAK